MPDLSLLESPSNHPPYIAVFCGSRPGENPIYLEAAEAMGKEMVRRGYGLVYGGGRVGMMGKIADTVMTEGGSVVGIMPDYLVNKEMAHTDISDLIIVPSMHLRKAKMAALSSGFVAMAGGLGTFEEICEVVTWTQLGLHKRPHGLLNTHGYYDAFNAQLDHAVEEGFTSSAHRQLLVSESTPAKLLNRMNLMGPDSPPPPPTPTSANNLKKT